MGIAFTSLILFLHGSPSLSTHFFHPCVKRCLPVVWNPLLKRRGCTLTLCFSPSSAKRLPRNASLSGRKRRESGGAKSGLQGGWRRRAHPTVAVSCPVGRPVCGLALSCKRTLPIFLFGRTLRICFSNFFNVCTYRSELNVAPLSENYTNKVPLLSQ